MDDTFYNETSLRYYQAALSRILNLCLQPEMSQGKTYTFRGQGLENTIISVTRGQGKSGNFI